MKQWYAACIIMVVKFKDGNQDKYPVWENVILVTALSVDEAIKKAEKLGREAEGDSDGTFTWDERPATWVFAGIRKIMDISSMNPGKSRITHGSKITYSRFELDSKESFHKLVNDEDVIVKYIGDQ